MCRGRVAAKALSGLICGQLTLIMDRNMIIEVQRDRKSWISSITTTDTAGARDGELPSIPVEL